MSPELIAVPAVGVAPGGMLLGGQRSTRVGIAEQRRDFGDLRERMARLEGLLEGLRDAVAGRQAAEWRYGAAPPDPRIVDTPVRY